MLPPVITNHIPDSIMRTGTYTPTYPPDTSHPAPKGLSILEMRQKTHPPPRIPPSSAPSRPREHGEVPRGGDGRDLTQDAETAPYTNAVKEETGIHKEQGISQEHRG